MRKRFRRLAIKPGQLKMYYGREDRWSSLDVIIAYGRCFSVISLYGVQKR